MSDSTTFDMELEVLREMGANIEADFDHYQDSLGKTDAVRVIEAMGDQINASAKRLLMVESKDELERIRGGFEFARACLLCLKGGRPG